MNVIGTQGLALPAGDSGCLGYQYRFLACGSENPLYLLIIIVTPACQNRLRRHFLTLFSCLISPRMILHSDYVIF